MNTYRVRCWRTQHGHFSVTAKTTAEAELTAQLKLWNEEEMDDVKDGDAGIADVEEVEGGEPPSTRWCHRDRVRVADLARRQRPTRPVVILSKKIKMLIGRLRAWQRYRARWEDRIAGCTITRYRSEGVIYFFRNSLNSSMVSPACLIIPASVPRGIVLEK